MYRNHTKCRACGNPVLVPVLDLGLQPPANNFTAPDGEHEGFAPLKVLFCRKCTLAQLSVVVPPEILYKDYCYVTSSGPTMEQHMISLLEDIRSAATKTNRLLEIGSNNGEFLVAAANGLACNVLGVEPAKNLAEIAHYRGVPTRCSVFNSNHAAHIAPLFSPDVIVARHVFAHIDDWKDFVAALEMVSHPNTLVVIEVPHVWQMIAIKSWDQIYHEHLSYVSLHAIEALLENTNFHLHDAKPYDIHGGSVGLFLRRNEFPRVGERGWCWSGEETLEKQWLKMAEEKNRMIDALKSIVWHGRRCGQKVVGYGASAKATVWLNACGFTQSDIAFVCDINPLKQGKIIAGTDIPVVPASVLATDGDLCVNFSWNFHAEIAEQQKAFTDRGGEWIQIVPEVKIL